jgi:hypothetical protein
MENLNQRGETTSADLPSFFSEPCNRGKEPVKVSRRLAALDLMTEPLPVCPKLFRYETKAHNRSSRPWSPPSPLLVVPSSNWLLGRVSPCTASVRGDFVFAFKSLVRGQDLMVHAAGRLRNGRSGFGFRVGSREA